jgi:hypothetical protein
MHVAGASAGPAASGGTVTFRDDGNLNTLGHVVGGLGNLNAIPVPIDATGNAALTTNLVPAGTVTITNVLQPRRITAIYSGDPNYPTRLAAVAVTVTKATPAIAPVTSSQNPQIAGSPVTFTTTVSGAGATPTGQATFSDGGTVIATANLTAAGVATFTTSTLTAGTHNISANYLGDTNYNTVATAAPALAQVISKADTTTTVVSSLPSANIGASVTFTATVAPVAPAVGTPTGTVTFLDGGVALGAAVSLAGGTATFTTSTLAAGSHTITVSYAGDGTFNASTSAAITQQINLLVSSTVVTAQPDPQTVGDGVMLTAMVTGAGPIPTLSVTFFDGATSLGSALLDPTGQATLVVNDLQVGLHSITASYGGDPFYAPSVSTPVAETIVTAGSALTLVSSPAGTALAGQLVTFTATVVTVAGGPPTGVVTFSDGGNVIGTGNVGAGGVASFATSTLALGPHTITAVYGGDPNHDGSSATVTLAVNPIPTTVALASSANPSVFGQAVTLTATVGATSATASGTVVFADGPTALGPGPIPVDGSGVATLVTSSLAVGVHNILATFTGGPQFTRSTSPFLAQTVTKGFATVTLATSTPGAVVGASVTFTATLAAAPPGSGTPTGTVTLTDSGNLLGTATLAGGVAAFTTTTLAVGTHNVTALYNGDGNFNGGTVSAPVTVVIGASDSSTALTGTPNPQTVGGAVTLTATVSTTGTGTPTGNVSFLDGATSLGTINLSGGTATLMTSALAPGSHTITASYSGDADFVPSTSAPVTEAILKAPSAVTVTSTPGTSTLGQSVRFDATVTSVAGGAVTGTVNFLDGGTLLGTAAVAGGVASFSTSALGVGPHTITAAYLGDASHNPASGTTTDLVTPNATTTALASSANPSVFGQPITLTATVTSTGAAPAGTVTFKDGAAALGTGPVQLDATGAATLVVSSLSVGPHTLTASYAGAPTLAASTSPAVSQAVGQASTTVTLATSSSPALPGATITLLAVVQVTAPGAGTPTGNVTFSEGPTVLGTVGLQTNGLVKLNLSTLSLGTHVITATYVGDTNFTGSTSAGLTEIISKTAVSSSLVAVPTSPTYGETVTFTATLVAATGGAPTGDVSFSEGTTTLGTDTLDANGVATFSTHTLVAGAHTITVAYPGDALHAGGSSASFNLIVAKRDTATTLVSAPNPSLPGQQVTLTATVAASTDPTAGGTDLVGLSGSVTFKDASTTLGTVTLAADGTAALTGLTLGPGSHTLTAVYGGADDYATSTSATLSHVVTPPTGSDGGADGAEAGAGDGPLGDGAVEAGGSQDAGADAGKSDAPTDAGKSDAPADVRPDAAAAQDAAADAAADAADAAGETPTGTGGGGGSGCGCMIAEDQAPSVLAFSFFAMAFGLALLRKRRPSSKP